MSGPHELEPVSDRSPKPAPFLPPITKPLSPLSHPSRPTLAMDSLRSTYDDDGDRTPSPPTAVSGGGGAANPPKFPFPIPPPPPPPPLAAIQIPPPPAESEAGLEEVHTPDEENGQDPNPNPALTETFNTAALDLVSDDGDDDDEDEDGSRKKQKTLSSFTSPSAATPSSAPPAAAAKKPKKKSNNVWTKPTSRKGKKKNKSIVPPVPAPAQDTVLIAPIPRFPDKSDDSPDAHICLSRVYKAEKVEISDDRLSASSSKGYRMVRATRGVMEGAWYFELRVVCLGETGHTRLGWTTEKGDLQAPVGYDENSYGYRDIDGSKIHKALREKYGEEGYAEGDVIGFYINLPNGESYAPKPPHLVWFKGQKYMYSMDGKDEPPKVVPGSEISFFKNGVCQGVAFTNLLGGRYYPAASMYTQVRPHHPNCEVTLNFGPDFEFFPEDFGGRPTPRPMIEVPYHGYEGRVEGSNENRSHSLKISS